MLLSTRSIQSAALRLAPLALAAATLAALPAHAVTFTEIGEAGQTVATAQGTGSGSAALSDVFGTLNTLNDIDLFLIRITSPSSFSATTVNAGSGQLDTVLFLLTQAGAPVYFNDDGPSGVTLGSLLPAGNAAGPVAAGVYLLGIALSGIEPTNANSQLLFGSGLNTDVRGAAAGLQPAVLGGYSNLGTFAPSGAYDIQLTGAAVAAAVPEPASGLLLALGVVLCAGAARRRSSAVAAAHG